MHQRQTVAEMKSN